MPYVPQTPFLLNSSQTTLFDFAPTLLLALCQVAYILHCHLLTLQWPGPQPGTPGAGQRGRSMVRDNTPALQQGLWLAQGRARE